MNSSKQRCTGQEWSPFAWEQLPRKVFSFQRQADVVRPYRPCCSSSVIKTWSSASPSALVAEPCSSHYLPHLHSPKYRIWSCGMGWSQQKRLRSLGKVQTACRTHHHWPALPFRHPPPHDILLARAGLSSLLTRRLGFQVLFVGQCLHDMVPSHLQEDLRPPWCSG